MVDMNLEEILGNRVSVRHYVKNAISQEDIMYVL